MCSGIAGADDSGMTENRTDAGTVLDVVRSWDIVAGIGRGEGRTDGMTGHKVPTREDVARAEALDDAEAFLAGIDAHSENIVAALESVGIDVTPFDNGLALIGEGVSQALAALRAERDGR